MGGHAAVADALTHRGGASHRPWAVGAPARWAGFNFPTGINNGDWMVIIMINRMITKSIFNSPGTSGWIWTSVSACSKRSVVPGHVANDDHDDKNNDFLYHGDHDHDN